MTVIYEGYTYANVNKAVFTEGGSALTTENLCLTGLQINNCMYKVLSVNGYRNTLGIAVTHIFRQCSFISNKYSATNDNGGSFTYPTLNSNAVLDYESCYFSGNSITNSASGGALAFNNCFENFAGFQGDGAVSGDGHFRKDNSQWGTVNVKFIVR